MKADTRRATLASQPNSPQRKLNGACSVALIFSLVVSVFSGSAYAQLPPPADSAQDSARQKLSALKFSAMQAIRESLARDLEQKFPEDSRASIYLDIDVASFVLQRVELFIDDRDPVVRNYSSREAGALLRQSTHRVLRDNFAPGAHHIRIEYSGQKRGAKPDDAPLTGSLELDFEATPQPQAFVLPVVPKKLAPVFSFFGRSAPKQWEWEDETEDPRLGLVRFLRDVGLEFAALQELMEIAGSPSTPGRLPPGYYRLLMHSYIDLGMRELAAATASKAEAQDADQDITETPGQTLTDAWLRLATLDYRRGDYGRALYVLDNIESRLSDTQRLWHLDIQSRVLLAQNKYADALDVLADANDILDDDDEDLYLPYLQRLYLRYNYAVAYIKNSQPAEGRTLLDNIGTVAQPNPAERAVRDHANLALAYQLLRSAKGGASKTVFQRLPLNGSYTDNALLGLGWSELTPQGTIVNRAGAGTYTKIWELGTIKPAPLAETKPEQLKRALVPWNELVGRNTDDAAVQEALIVIPFALEELGRRAQAAEAYEQAITRLTTTQRKLEGDIESLRAGSETRALLFRYAASGLPYTRWTDDVRTSNPIEEHVQNFHDLQRLQGALQDNDAPNAALLNNALGYAGVDQMRKAQANIADALEVQLDRVEEFHTTAINGLARYYDWSLNQGGEELDPEDIEQLEPGLMKPDPAL